MALMPRLDLRQSQSLVMTPQLQQAIKLLQLSNVELLEFVEQELAENPMLERDENHAESAVDTNHEAGGSLDQVAEGEIEDTTLDAVDYSNLRNNSAIESDLDVDVDNEWNTDDSRASEITHASMLDSAFSDGSSRSASDFFGESTNLEETVTESFSLRERLNSQMGIAFTDPVEKLIATRLIDMLDDSGYVVDDLVQVSNDLGCSTAIVEEVLKKLQEIDTPGLFARNLSECLALQLRELNRLDPAMQALLENLDLLARRDVNSLVKICGVDEEDIVEMFAEIRELDPRPAQAFENTLMQPIVPDVIMKGDAKDGWIIELNNETLPRVLVNNTYFSTVISVAGSKEDKRYINDCYQSANWLVKSLHQRATTILKVASEIVRQQDTFFSKGVQYLRPLVLRDIADAIDMHESTVSRVTSNKYIASPRGIFELKYFFTAAIASSSGDESYSAESVRHRIKNLIDEETVDQILSDDKIVRVLKKEGMAVARRTVAKYREAMGIASSVQRRHEKKSVL